MDFKSTENFKTSDVAKAPVSAAEGSAGPTGAQGSRASQGETMEETATDQDPHSRCAVPRGLSGPWEEVTELETEDRGRMGFARVSRRISREREAGGKTPENHSRPPCQKPSGQSLGAMLTLSEQPQGSRSPDRTL